MRGVALSLAISLIGGCTLDRAALQPGETGQDAGLAFDAGRVDTGLPRTDGSTEPVDAFSEPLDGTAGDAFVATDAAVPVDAAIPVDAAVPRPDGGCVVTAESCNGRDDDCDGRVDEGSTDCPCAGITAPTGHAYLFCTDDADWTTASARCEGFGYTLVVIDDATENAVVRTGHNATFTGNFGWIGLSDRSTEGTFVWVDGRVQRVGGSDMGYERWSSGEPNNFLDREDCAEMIANGRWNDSNCGNTQPYICEASP